MTIEPRAGAPWWWQVDDDGAVYSGTAQTEAKAWRRAHAAMDRVSPVMVARAEGLAAGLDAMRTRAEAAEARAAQAEADARLMAGLAFAGFVARTSFSIEIVDASLLDALEAASDHTAAMSDVDLIDAARRILAAGGAA